MHSAHWFLKLCLFNINLSSSYMQDTTLLEKWVQVSTLESPEVKIMLLLPELLAVFNRTSHCQFNTFTQKLQMQSQV